MRLFPVVFLTFLLGLSACTGPAAEKMTTFDPPETPGGELCTTQCREAQDYCLENCTMDQRRCTTDVQTKAMRDYDKYTRDQFTAHEPIELHARDFERMQPCDDAKKSCTADCASPYQTCYQNCGGKVEIETSCQFLCF